MKSFFMVNKYLLFCKKLFMINDKIDRLLIIQSMMQINKNTNVKYESARLRVKHYISLEVK